MGNDLMKKGKEGGKGSREEERKRKKERGRGEWERGGCYEDNKSKFTYIHKIRTTLENLF